MTSVLTQGIRLLGVLALLGLFAADASAQSASISAPSSAQGGSMVRAHGTSSSGAAGTTITVTDNNGPVPYTVDWDHDKLVITFTMPEYDPNDPDNEVVITVDPGGGHPATTSVKIT